MTTEKVNGHEISTEDIVAVVRGKMTQGQLSDRIGGSTSTVSRKMNDYLKSALMEVSEERDELKTGWDALQSECNRLKSERDALQNERDNLEKQRDAMKLEKEEALSKWEQLKNAETELKADLGEMEAKFKKMKAEYDRWNGKTRFEHIVGSSAILAILSVLLILFDFHAIWDNLQGFVEENWVSQAISIGVASALLVFTVRDNRHGRIFCIAVSFIAAALYCDFLTNLVETFEAIWNLQQPSKKNLGAIFFTVTVPTINWLITKEMNKG